MAETVVCGTGVPRLWLSPKGETVVLGEGGDGHGMAVAKDPARFGLPEGHFDAHLADVNDVDKDVEFDFDAAIALAHARGWARVSHDSQTGVAIGAGDVRGARKAVRHLLAAGVAVPAADIEISTVAGDRVVAFFCRIEGEEVDKFVRLGCLPHGKRFEMPLSTPELLDLASRPAPSAM